MTETVRCSSCGTELLQGASPQGLCAACLLKLGLSSTNIPAVEIPTPRRQSRWKTFAVLAAMLLILVAIAIAFMSIRRVSPVTNSVVLRFNLTLPNAEDFALSPDGRRLAFTAINADGKRLLWTHSMDSFVDMPLAETDGAAAPFWSPDSRFVGFFARGKLRKVDIGNGASEVLCDAPTGRSGAWSNTGIIVFERNASNALFRVSDRGGLASLATKNNKPEHSDIAHRWPHFLPDGRHFIYTSLANNDEDAGIFVSSIETGEVKRLFNDRSQAIYSADSLLFVRTGILLAQPFDSRRIEVVGDARAIRSAEHVDRFSTSGVDMLAYRQGVELRPSPLVWIDRQGKLLGPIEGLAGAVQFSVSPDGRRVAASRSGDIWLAELDRGVVSRFTFDPGQDAFPIWSPDGRSIVFASNRAGRKGLYQKATNSSTGEELLLTVPQLASVDSWSADGRFILYTSVDEKGKSAVWMVPTEGDRKPSMITAPFSRREPRFSPDARLLAYVSDESGNDEVYIEAFPPGGAKWQVSLNGGARPAWRNDGRELFYVSKDGMLMSVAISRGAPALEISSPRPLFGMQEGRYEVARDIFLMSQPVEDRPAVPIHIVVNWTNEIRRQ